MESYAPQGAVAEQDMYSQYATNILVEKRARKVAEDDALRLYNRVRQLQKEEEKAQKRIQETKKKAKDIIKLRERNELIRQEKEHRFKELQLEVERQKLENLKLKEETLRNRTEQENRIYSEKVSLVQQTKEERTELERLLAESRLLARKEALEQKEAVRRAQDDARRRLETLKLQKLQQAQEEYERRLKEEIDAKMQKEQEIEKLAELEMQLIERLKSKQHEQKKAYQQLEAVLSLGGRATSKSDSPGRILTPPPNAPASQPGEPTEEDVARAFSVYDEDATGEIPTSSMDGLMRDLGVPLSAPQLSQAIAQLDVDNTGRISFGEFLLWWKG